MQALPGYGTLPFVTSSVCRIPNDHTSDFIVNRPYSAASGAVHLIGNFAPKTVLTILSKLFLKIYLCKYGIGRANFLSVSVYLSSVLRTSKVYDTWENFLIFKICIKINHISSL